MTFHEGYDAFPVPVDPPGSEPGDSPLITPAFNSDWLPSLLGAVTALQDPQIWKGDDAAKEVAVKRARNLMDILASAPPNATFRQNTECQLQISQDDGATW